MEREVGGGIGMGNTCKPMAVSFQCMTKSTTNKKKKPCLSPVSFFFLFTWLPRVLVVEGGNFHCRVQTSCGKYRLSSCSVQL